MTENFIGEIRAIHGFNNAILQSVVLEKSSGCVQLNILTNTSYTEEDMLGVQSAAKKYIPEPFTANVEVSKITPDCDMIKRRIYSLACGASKLISSTLREEDIKVTKTEDGFSYVVAVTGRSPSAEFTESIDKGLKNSFCDRITGSCVQSDRSTDDIEIEEEGDNIEYLTPVRTFKVCNFKAIEGSERPASAVYISDLNFESESVVICGRVDNVSERTYKRKDDSERVYFVFTLNDGTGGVQVTCFARLRTIDKIRAIAEGDKIVCTCKAENHNGAIRFTTISVDYGEPPEGFVPEKRKGKPAPKYYTTIKPQVYVDFSQADMFADNFKPDCLKNNVFVVLDLETTGRNTMPSAGMDRITEIGACKIEGGIIKESFSTLVNPKRKLSEEIVKLTGITDEMLKDAPTYEQVMPDFYKFCDGAYLVGHNIAGFDWKFIEYYWNQLGYIPERRLFDTLPLAQEQLFLKNYKLNTIADRFGFSFNHHRALDDAVVTAKIFMELIKLKKSLPKTC